MISVRSVARRHPGCQEPQRHAPRPASQPPASTPTTAPRPDIDAAGNPVGDSDPSHYYGVDSGIDIEKYTNGVDADTRNRTNRSRSATPSTGPTWSQNTGNVTLTDIDVDDNIPGVAPIYSAGDTNSNDKLDRRRDLASITRSGVATAGQYANDRHRHRQPTQLGNAIRHDHVALLRRRR